MANDNPYIPNPPVPVNESEKIVESELILKENFNKESLKALNSGNTEFILPDEVKVKEKKEKE
ncbi:hypothetical protein [Vagococcus fluvialis]|jgi:hypothetical protein|uniref:Uncharacterized protein n=1 Tax=Vagococcus fluvialis TaxID=2738 RepID=A0A369B095_9ENTE|nr:hypothetical protein [Vagococcus fluvialis]MDR2278945.1 hypothetical protein [Vagococcus sp.]OTP31343.1 hypothetical protein A5798_001365 [Enterococcus sp. 6C8_DIV0013]MBO0418690.1 hypothetical protein [Vagococcus fluvialis]MBO0436528.1 hypothetical protein [Vagococcus fluvialis]MBO0443229.1 hypothetical protein [Vagococcus fluvialis]